MNTTTILLIIFIGAFVLSLFGLFYKQIFHFLSAIFNFVFVKPFKFIFKRKTQKETKKKVTKEEDSKKLKAHNEKIIPVLLAPKTPSLNDPNKNEKQEMDTCTEESEGDKENNSRISLSKLTSGNDFRTAQKRKIEKELMQKKIGDIDDFVKNSNSTIKSVEKDDEDFKSEFLRQKHNSLSSVIQKRNQNEEEAILNRRRSETIGDISAKEENDNNTEIIIDNEKIDLSNLPIKIKKLLIMGILDQKNF